MALDDGPCGKPRDLPFRAVKALLARYPDDAFLAFNEADLLWDYASAAFAMESPGPVASRSVP